MYNPNPEPLNPQQRSKARKRFEWLASFLIVNYGFVHHILQVMSKTEKVGLGTMGVRVMSGGRFELWYDPAFVNELTDEEAVYVFFHEVLHLALHHCTRRKFSNHELGNIATDLAVNELINVKAGSCEPPKDKDGNIVGVHVGELKKNPVYSDIEERQSAEWYYDYLQRKAKEQCEANGGDGQGDCGECSQTKCPLSGAKKEMDDHEGWKEDELADTQVKARIDSIARNNQWGNVSASFKEAVMAAQVRRINWRNIIRRTFGNILWKDRETTRKRPNRRTGYIHPGSKRIHVDKGLIAGDTSASVEAKLLAMFVTVMNGISDFFPIDLVQFDHDITDGPRPWSSSRDKFEFTGRGGTNFDPVVKLAEERRYKVLVILTDGEASPPPQPRGVQVVWVLPRGKNPPVSWGTAVHLDEYV